MPLHRRLARSMLLATSPQRQGVGWWDVSEVALVALGFLLYFLVRGAPADRTEDALQHARSIVDLERSLGMFIEPHVQEWVLSAGILWRLMNFVYFWFDFPLIVGVGLFMFFRSRTYYTLLRDSLLLSGGLALLIYYTFPVAPPRYLTDLGFVDTLEVYSNLSYQAQSMQPFVNPYAAVPSLHVGWSALLAYAVFRATANVFARAAVLGVFVLQCIAVMGTGNHFAFDGFVGLLVCALGLAMAMWLQRAGYPAVRGRLAAWADIAPGGEARRRRHEARAG
ncbi:MAG TPA: phosphatase PAP2 family protein [Dehalococcoidia bacterium]|nr:phosphatase PAP2 family protein [Dehalococcoidia bacterium]